MIPDTHSDYEPIDEEQDILELFPFMQKAEMLRLIQRGWTPSVRKAQRKGKAVKHRAAGRQFVQVGVKS
jgi:hypothetical protein